MEQKATYSYAHQLNILRDSEHVIADTDGERDHVMSLGVPAWRVTTAGCGVHEAAYPLRDQGACRQRLGLPKDAFVVLFMGRQVQYKGIESTLEAFMLLQRRHPAIRLVVAGPDTEYSRRLFARWQGQPGIINVGCVSDEMRLDVLNACDCMVLPSSGEAFGIVYLEAWTVGKPVVGAHTLAVSSVIADGVDGWLVPVGDSVALARVLERWIDEPHLARRMGERGRDKVLRRFTVGRVADVVEGVYLRTVRSSDRLEGLA
jgi:glycosyltransferase involved in cell wall biosynthesis